MRHVGTDAWRGFCKGLELSMELDGNSFVGGTAFLFGTVLSRFFGYYVGMAGFTELVMFLKQQEQDKIRWEPRSGEQVLV